MKKYLPSPLTASLLQYGSFALLCHAIAIIFYLLTNYSPDASGSLLLARYCAMSRYTLTSLLVLLFSATLLEYCQRKYRSKE